MASLVGVCTQDLTYTPVGETNPRTGASTPGVPRTVKGRFVRAPVLVRDPQGSEVMGNGEGFLLPEANPKVGEKLEGYVIREIFDIRDRTQLLGYKVRV